jgi:hypothetical protein
LDSFEGDNIYSNNDSRILTYDGWLAWYGHVLGSSSHVERLTDFGFGGIGELLAAPRVESDE